MSKGTIIAFSAGGLVIIGIIIFIIVKMKKKATTNIPSYAPGTGNITSGSGSGVQQVQAQTNVASQSQYEGKVVRAWKPKASGADYGGVFYIVGGTKHWVDNIDKVGGWGSVTDVAESDVNAIPKGVDL